MPLHLKQITKWANILKHEFSLPKNIINEDKICDILKKLSNIEMTVNCLKITKIGIIVKKFGTQRRDISPGISQKSKTLVNAWKMMATKSLKKKSKAKHDSIQNNSNASHSHPKQKQISHQHKQQNNQIMLQKKRKLTSVENKLRIKTDNVAYIDSNSNKRRKLSEISSTQKSVTMPCISMPNGCNHNSIFNSSSSNIPSLTQICMNLMRRHASEIGHISVNFDPPMIQAMYGSLSSHKLRIVHQFNPQMRKGLDILWKKRLLCLQPTYKISEDNTWFEAHEKFVIENKQRMKDIQMNFIEQHVLRPRTNEAAINDNSSGVNTTPKLMKYMNHQQIKQMKSRRKMKEFVQRRKQMFGNEVKMNAKSRIKERWIARQKKNKQRRSRERHGVCEY